MTKQAVHLFETGRARPTMARLETIVRRLGNVSVEEVLADTAEHRMVRLEEQQRYEELSALARSLLRASGTTRRTRSLAGFYLGRAQLDQAPARAATLLRRAQRQLARAGEPRLAAEAMDWEAAAMYLLQDPEAVKVGQRALERYRELPDRQAHVEARMLEHLATYRLQRGEHVQALSGFRDAIAVAGTRLELTRLANIYHGMAEGCRQAGECRQALAYMERAVHLYRTEHDVRGHVGANLARAENDYGVHLMRLGQWERAEEMILAALDHYAACGVEAARAHAMLSMGELHQLRGSADEALEWTLQAVWHAERLGETVALASACQQLGELWWARGDGSRFDACFDRAVEILTRAGLPQRLAECRARRARVEGAARTTRPAAG